jgi:hypothetical protein
MRCLECERPVGVAGLLVAMEQKEHFALMRHAEVCQHCAVRLLDIFENFGTKRNFRQSLDCAYCGSKMAIARFRFEIKDHAHRHIALCEPCYKQMREHLRDYPSVVGFVELEWQTAGKAGGKRLPWPNGSVVQASKRAGRFAGQLGIVERFRPLVQPWFGYEVKLKSGVRHFFHERDLQLVTDGDPAEKQNTEQVS